MQALESDQREVVYWLIVLTLLSVICHSMSFILYIY